LAELSRGGLLPKLLALALLYAAGLTLPEEPRPYATTGLDPSWQLGLNLAHGRGMVAGRDVVFTYGPLGYLNFPEPVSGTPVLAFAYRIGLYLLLLVALTRLVWILPSKAAAFWTALIVGLGAALDAQSQDNQVVLTITLAALLALVDHSKWRRLELLLLSFLASLALMVKLNQGAEGVALLLVVLAAVRARRQAVEAIGILLLSSVVLFFAATGSVLELGSYLRYGWEIVSGYSEVMGLPGPLWQAALACAALAALAAIPLVATDLRALLPGFAPAAVAAFFVFKQAMVRQDGHAVVFHIRFAVVLLFLLVCAGTVRDRRLIVLLQLFSIAMAYVIQTERFPGLDSVFKARLELRQAYRSLSAFGHAPAVWQEVGTRNQINRAKLRLPDDFHQLIGHGTVDAIPWNADLVQGNGWQWQPRPVFQSYSAYTPVLDDLNASYMESARAADFVILDFSATDYRHPFLDTPVSWRALLDRYDLKLAGAGYFLLQHRQTSRYGPLAPLGSSMAHWDADVRVPQAGGLLVMAPHLQASLSGKLASMLFRTAPVWADVAYSSGQTAHWRCVPRNLAGGFLVRPFPQDLEELRPLFLALRDSPEQMVSIRFHTDRPGEFKPDIPIDWFRLPLAEGK
jgi:hypothetical protein